MATFAVTLNWTGSDDRRWAAFYRRRGVSMNAVVDMACRDFSMFVKSGTHPHQLSISVCNHEDADFPAGVDEYTPAHMSGRIHHVGNMFALCEDGSTRLYMVVNNDLFISDWYCHEESPSNFIMNAYF